MTDQHRAYFQRHTLAAPPVSTLEENPKPARNLLGCAFLFSILFWIGLIGFLIVYFHTHHK